MPAASLQHRRRGGNHDLEAVVAASSIADNNDVCNSPNSIITNRVSGGVQHKQRKRRKRPRRFPLFTPLLGGKLIVILATLCAILLFCSYRMNITVHRQVNNNPIGDSGSNGFQTALEDPQTTKEEDLPEVHLPVPNVDIVVPDAIEWPLIHIVNTRFMQEQGALETLGMARLHLFLTFCFPTMINQSIQDWFWIIRTDPKFTTTHVFQKLVRAVEEYPNIYVVASNRNYLINPQTEGCWRDGLECMDLLRSKIYSGNITQLHQAIALRNERPVLETRLDADDGLHKYYMQYIQWAAVKKFKIPLGIESKDSEEDGDRDGDGNGDENSEEEEEDAEDTDPLPPARWLYWCTRRHLEWHSSLNKAITLRDHSHAVDISAGVLNPVEHSKLCVTPGITVGYNVGVDAKDVPVYPHNSLLANVGNTNACYYGDDNSNEHDGEEEDPHSSDAAPDGGDGCVDLVERLLFCALRSRTWTSAGMRNVGLDPRVIPGEALMSKLWELLEERFTIDRMRASVTQSYLIDNQKQIAYENLLGQCTSGHSCKEDAKKELRRIIVEGK